MTAMRSFKTFHRFPNLWCGNRVVVLYKYGNMCQESLVCRNAVRNFRHSRQQVKTAARQAIGDVQKFEQGPVDSNRMWKPICFTFAISTASLGAAAIWQYENIRSKSKSLFRQPSNWLNDHIGTKKKGKWRQEVNRRWNILSEGEKVFLPICLVNVLVFLAWQVPKWQPVMLRYFCSNPAAKALCWPLILSVFSHYSFFHLAANMYVLHSFSEGAVASLGKEQFLGLYMTAGATSSLTSLLYKTFTGSQGFSLGASGALMAVIGYICVAYPNTDLSIVLLPFITFKASLAIKALMAVDTAGLIMRWQFFDHAAHLGGAITGIAWCCYGQHYIWSKRNVVVQKWHDFRSSMEK